MIVPSSSQIYGEWTRVYMEVLQKGYEAMPDWMKDMPVEEGAGILRGMMVEAGKAGLIPTAAELVTKLDSEPCPDFQRADELAKPEEKPKPASEAAKPVQPAEKPKEQTKLPDAPESIPAENTYHATDKQIIAIGKWRITKRYDEIAAEYLRAHKKSKACELTITEASELITLFGEERNKGTKV